MRKFVLLGSVFLAGCSYQQRFVPVADTAAVALDTKTGQLCRTTQVTNRPLPSCLDLYKGK